MPNKTIEEQAIHLVKTEKHSWEDATVFITEKIAFQMRNLIRQCRKNYWGIFDQQTDPTTGRKKIWVPMTEVLTEAVVKNIDLDTKDINFRAKKASAIGLTALVRNVIKNYLDNTYFGEDLDMTLRQLAMDGTVVWKTTEEYNEEPGKKIAKRRIVDLLNFYIDPTAESINATGSVTERAVISIDEFKSMKDWFNKDEIEGTTEVSKNDEYLTNTNPRTEIKYVEIFERWGKIPKSFITGNKKDVDLLEGQIVCSAVNGSWKLHYISKNTKGVKPYEEAWMTRVPGRWYGKGVPEKIMMLQLWINTIVNIRINRSYISQLGIFKIKKNAGITPQMLSRLPANGAVPVNDMNDIEQMVMTEASQASYKDEDVINSWAERLTSAFEVVTGESMPSSTTATAIATQTRTAQSAFALIKEGVGSFLQRWVKRQLMPIVQKSITKEEVYRVTGEIEEVRELDNIIVDKALYEQISAIMASGEMVDETQIERVRQDALAQLGSQGKDRFVTLMNDINLTDYDVQVYITNEEIDKGVLTQNLISILQLAPEYKDVVLRQAFDIMGLDSYQLKKPMMNPMMQQGMPQPPTQNPQEVFTNANV